MASNKNIERLERIQLLLKSTKWNFIKFNHQTMYRSNGGYKVLTREDMIPIYWEEFPGGSMSQVGESQEIISGLAQPHSDPRIGDYIATAVNTANPKVWDTKNARWLTPEETPLDWVYQTDIVPNNNTAPVKKWLLELAQGDEDLAYDYIQAIAPIMLQNKPAGIVWFVGSGSNGKSSLLKVVHKLFSRYLVSMTTAALEDGRDTPRLNGMLGNICLEASEARVEDSERYKALGTHERFSVHKFHSQETIDVFPNCHTIFNSNNIPTFRDKTKGSKRRTLVVPFNATFADDPNYDAKLMTPEFLGGFLQLLSEAATELHERGTKYKWSDATNIAKGEYDDSVNSAEAYVKYMVDANIVAFKGYRHLYISYENYCSANGLEPLRVGQLKRAVGETFPVWQRWMVEEDGKRFRCYTTTDDFEGVRWWDDGMATRHDLKPEMAQAELGDW